MRAQVKIQTLCEEHQQNKIVNHKQETKSNTNEVI